MEKGVLGKNMSSKMERVERGQLVVSYNKTEHFFSSFFFRFDFFHLIPLRPLTINKDKLLNVKR